MPEERNFKLKLAYDGKNYSGWQDNSHAPSIEGILREAIERIVNSPVKIQAASRTDAGVHANGQIAQFFCRKDNINIGKFKKGINALLPEDISCLELKEVAADFHPTLDAREKVYHYFVDCGDVQLPHKRHYSWHFPYALNIENMLREAKTLCGKHDFAAFSNQKKNESYESTLRNLRELQILQNGSELCFVLRGNSFLYKMVRNIVGYLIYVGCGKLPSGQTQEFLSQKKRCLLGVCAPAHGLFLHEIIY